MHSKNFLKENFNVPRETIELLNQYENLLIKWNKKINLIANSTINEIWDRHIIDSAQLKTYLHDTDKIIDLGSGGGLPAIILSILGLKEVSLIESDSRKCAFLQQAKLLSPHNISIYNDRVENLELNCDVITARGFANIKKILDITKLIGKNKLLLLKGEKFEDELKEALIFYDFDYKLYNSITNSNSKIIEIYNIKESSL